MQIACLGWGSLLWDPRTLPMVGGFEAVGPWLPIEFSRVASDGRVTLVIDPSAAPIRTQCVRLDAVDLDSAIAALGVREKIGPERRREWIGVQTRSQPDRDTGATPGPVRETIATWLGEGDFDAVVWTALPARTPDGRFAEPTLEALIAHLESLRGSARARAEEYIRRAPATTRTLRRDRFEAAFGWTPLP